MGFNKYQTIEHSGIIKYVTSPNGDTMVKIVSPDRFMQMEGSKLEKDYCCIVDDRCYISKKADYNTVVIHYTPNMKP